MKPRVRFAPSPTGFLHIGGARTALYNWLYARHMGGTFILRIEDTDEARSTKESLDAILKGLKWLGLDWDEGPSEDGDNVLGDVGPYFQMERAQIYQDHLKILLEKEKAYPCFCSKEDLEQMRKRAMLLKRPPKYDGRCRRLSKEEREGRLAEKTPHVYRFARPDDGRVEFNDVVKGLVRFESEQLDDFILVKSSGIPTFMFAGAIDDFLMNVTHVIRGDDHLSNTPRQLQLFDAFGWDKRPVFAHISMIHGPDGSRLSKRHGATSIEEFQKLGFLPEAMLNYLSLLGWSTSDSQQLFSPENQFKELVEKFELERCQKSPAIFDNDKLSWMNGVYIRALPQDEILKRAWPHLVKAGLVQEEESAERKEFVKKALLLEQEKMTLFSEAPGLVDFLLKDDLEWDSAALDKVFSKEGAAGVVEGLKTVFSGLSELTAENTESACREYAQKNNLKTGQVFHPVRVSVSGRTKGPSLFHMLELLGKEKTLQRMTLTLEKLKGAKA